MFPSVGFGNPSNGWEAEYMSPLAGKDRAKGASARLHGRKKVPVASRRYERLVREKGIEYSGHVKVPSWFGCPVSQLWSSMLEIFGWALLCRV